MYSADGGYRRGVASLRFKIAQASLNFTISEGTVYGEWIATRRGAGSANAATQPEGTRRSIATLVARWRAGKSMDRRAILSLLPSQPEFFFACWKACMRIPRGETRTYAWLASAAGRPRAVRAAAASMVRNPLPLLVPCHRVVGTGNAGGFCGASHSDRGSPRDRAFLDLKDRLLDIERST